MGGLNELALFAGAGGGILGSHLLGWNTVCAVEIEEYPRRVLLSRQRDGILPRFPIWDDIRTFDGKPWRGRVDVVSGGFPCQDISSAGKGRGLSGNRSGLVFEMLRIVDEVQPLFVFAENSPLLRTRGLGTILKELDRLGYDARWGVLGARHVGAPHRRDRMWILAYSDGDGKHAMPKHAEMAEPSKPVSHPSRKQLRDEQERSSRENGEGAAEFANNGEKGTLAYSYMPRSERENRCEAREECARRRVFNPSRWWDVEPQLGRVADGVADRVDRLKAIGNGQVPAVAALAWNILSEGILPSRDE